eukprot:Selendium_serpulae@DN1718_c0_g1_i1.p1
MYVGWAADGAMWFASELKALQTDCVQYRCFLPGTFFYYAGDASSSVDPASPICSKKGAKGAMLLQDFAFHDVGKTASGNFVQYWQPSWLCPEKPIPQTPACLERIRDSLVKSVEKRLLSDLPIGVLLSGGLDSSLVAGICKQLYDRKRETHPEWFAQLHSFCIGLEGSPDLKFAKQVAAHLGTRHHNIVFNLADGMDALSDVIYHLETYDVTTIRAATPMFLMSRYIKSMGIKVVLSGEGADELFGGYLYFHKAPNAEEFHRELQRKVAALHLFDVLRANKSTMAWGVEVRVPFLDQDFLNVAMDINAEHKMCTGGRIEKGILRDAFKDSNILPPEVLYRQKEQFSDGVGYSWIDSLKQMARDQVKDAQLKFAEFVFPHNTPTTKEAYFYRQIFNEHFPRTTAALTVPGGPSIACSSAKALEWDPSFRSNADQSGRSVLGVHHSANPVAPTA